MEANMKKYLEYQEVDLKLYRLESDMKNNECFKEYAKSSNTVKLATEKLAKLEAEAGDLYAQLDKFKATFEKIKAELAELLSAVEDVEDLKEIEYYQSSIEKLVSKAETLEKDINRTIRDINDKVKLYSELMERGKNATKAKKEYAEKCKALKEEKQPEADAIRAELNAIEKDLDPAVMARYKALRASKKPPYFVQLSGSNCTGCGMELAYDTLSKLKNAGDHTECPNCQKILYK